MADEKLTITRCTLQGGSLKVSQDEFVVMLNPSGFTHDRSISYSGSSPTRGAQNKPLGISSAETKFGATEPETVKFSIVIDGTGVVTSPPKDVKAECASLKAIVYDYDGNTHETNIVQLKWGNFLFYGRLTSMSVEYTLFKPSGEPLRAKVSLAFVSYMSREEEAKRAKRSSPDLSHRVVVKAGDTLPLLCYRIYRDSSYYGEVARINNLTDFRNIAPGTELLFPPLR